MKNLFLSKTVKAFFTMLVFIISVGFLQSCSTEAKEETKETVSNQKIGLLLVNHGSHSETWRNALLDLEKNVTDTILKNSEIKGIKTAFMEYNEPSIATRLKEFDKDGYTDVIIVPVFLTVSPHSFEDIPTIIGQKEDPTSMEMLKIEKIERYTPKVKTHLTPLLDFTDILQKNVLRRTEALSANPEKEGLVLIGYGDETYDKEWGELFDKVAEYVKQHKGISTHNYGWCGHIAHYKSEETTKAIDKVLKKKDVAVVIPVLVAHDENFQIKIIGGGIDKVKNNKERVLYKPDAILPDVNVESWIISTTFDHVLKVKQTTHSK